MPSYVRSKFSRIAIALLLLALTALAVWTFYNKPFARARVLAIKLDDATPAQLVKPARTTESRVLLIMPHDTRLSDEELLAFAQHGNTRVVQFELSEKRDCALAANQVNAALKQLDGEPDLVAGIGTGGEAAYRWLAAQGNPKARALAVELDITHPLCDAPIPEKAPNGHLSVRWNDGPDDVTARMLRNLESADTTITDYSNTAPQMLIQGIHMALAGTAAQMPTVEVRLDQPPQSDTVTLFYSGDGGWRDLDRRVADQMTLDGYPVVGVDVLRYFWEHKSPEQAAADLSRLMQTYREKWGAKRFVLAGYSFGADILPALYNRLPETDRNQIDAMLLLAFARTGSFEIEVSGWLGQAGQEAQTAPEMAKVPASKILCVYGKEEVDESGCTQPGAIGERLMLPGGHHFDEDYPKLARRLVQAIQARTPK
ncbi:MAG: virulence factor family protein [Comamonadaceae bacterium]|nr:MAG: virulence factor family protein [Comamonadaceae bacterium]